MDSLLLDKEEPVMCGEGEREKRGGENGHEMKVKSGDSNLYRTSTRFDISRPSQGYPALSYSVSHP